MFDKKTFFKNLYFAFGAQTISLLLSILMSLFLPKLLTISEFGFWQLFLFFTGYVGVTSFGLNEGIYLNNSGKTEEDVNFSIINGQFRLLVINQLVILIVMLVLIFYIGESERSPIFQAVLLYMVLYNFANFFGYFYQSMNKTRIYSISVILDKLVFLCLVFYGIYNRHNDFEFFMYAYIFTKALSLTYLFFYSRHIIGTPIAKMDINFDWYKKNIKSGLPLMLSTIISLFIIGSGRYVSELKWGIETFAKISFAITITSFFMLFLNQLGMVIFPAIKSVENEYQRNIYVKINDVILVILPAVFLFLPLIEFFIGWWLPHYRDSFNFFKILLPVVIFDARMQLLGTPYLKIFRKERMLFVINLSAVLISLIGSLISAFLFNQVTLLLMTLVIAVATRSIITELYLGKLIKIKVLKSILTQLFFICLFYLIGDKTIFGYIVYSGVLLYYAYYKLYRRKLL